MIPVLSRQRIDEIIGHFLVQLPEEERKNAYEDILYLYNKEIKNLIQQKNFESIITDESDESLLYLNQIRRKKNEQSRSSSENSELSESVLINLVKKFVEFRILAITPQSISNEQIKDYHANRRKTIKNFSFTGNVQKIPKTDAQRRMFSKIFQSSIFSVLTTRQRAKFIDCLKPRETYTDEVIIRKGEYGDKLFFLEKGRFGLILDEHEYEESRHKKYQNNGIVRKIQFENKVMIEVELPNHMVTGEIALLHGIPRTATIISREPGIIWYLERSSYNTIRLFDEEQKWRTFVDKMEKLGWSKGDIASQAQGYVFESNSSVRLIQCKKCRNFTLNCCSYSKRIEKSSQTPTHLFFSSFSAEVQIHGKSHHIKSADIIYENFHTLTEIEGYILPLLE